MVYLLLTACSAGIARVGGQAGQIESVQRCIHLHKTTQTRKRPRPSSIGTKESYGGAGQVPALLSSFALAFALGVHDGGDHGISQLVGGL